MPDTPLADVRKLTAGLSAGEFGTIVDAATKVLSTVYVHAACEAKQRVEQALERLAALKQRANAGIGERAFHDEMLAVFKALRDRHTHYSLPSVFHNKVAFLPLLVTTYVDHGARRYIVKQAQVPDTPEFAAGANITGWNGRPINDYLDDAAEQEDGARPDARHSRALAALTVRPTWLLPLPEDDYARVEYTIAGETHVIELPWMVRSFGNIAEVEGELLRGVDLQSEVIREFAEALFQEDSFVEDAAIKKLALPSEPQVAIIRISSFGADPGDVQKYILDALKDPPADGVIIDIRGNPGGYIPAGECALQLFTSERIEPTLWQFRATPETLQLCTAISNAPKLPEDLRQQFGAYIPSIGKALSSGATFSDEFPATSPDAANALGPTYDGPLLLVTDALTYSVGDIFTAGIQDHSIGPVLGEDVATGGGGSNEVSYHQLAMFLPHIFAPLPGGVSFGVSMRRARRVRKSAGVLVERLGVKADQIHERTIRDAMESDADLFVRAAEILRTAARSHT